MRTSFTPSPQSSSLEPLESSSLGDLIPEGPHLDESDCSDLLKQIKDMSPEEAQAALAAEGCYMSPEDLAYAAEESK